MKKQFPPAPYCTECGGKCCKRFAGACFPGDFREPLSESVLAALQSKKYAVDSWDGDIHVGGDRSEVYFIRPAHKNSDEILDRSWGGECIFLTPTGCSLSWEQRPTGCKCLEPIAGDKKCKSHSVRPEADGMPKLDACYAWDNYQGMIATILKKLT